MSENMVTFRVARVVSKHVHINHISLDEYQSFTANDQTVDNLTIDDKFAEDWQLLPQNIGNVYLGETFSCYISCTNDSVSEVITDVFIKVDLQGGNRAVTIGETNCDSLDAKQCANNIIRHEVKEMGSHMLICTINFLTNLNEKQSLRKYFKFQVLKPIDVKTKFYNAESDEVYLEALLQNLTSTPICLERVMLEPSPHFDVKPMNTILNDQNEEQWVFGKTNRFNPQECRQYLFCLIPKTDLKYNSKLLRHLTAIGKLDIIWLSGIGERGHLQTSQLERMAPSYGDLKLIIEQIPSKVAMKTKFTIIFRLINCCERKIEPKLYIDNGSENQALLWLGLSGQSLGSLEPSQFIDFQLNLYAIQIGMHSLPLIKITDSSSKNDYKFDEIAFVYVEEIINY